MTFISASLICLFGFQNNFDKTKKTQRSSLAQIAINESQTIVVMARMSGFYEYETIDVNIFMYDPNDLKKTFWKTNIGTVEYGPNSKYNMCLVYLDNESIFIYNCWNQKSFLIDKNNGKILKKSDSENALLAYPNLMPIKLDIIERSSGIKKLSPKEP